jgi:hypothetical protein
MAAARTLPHDRPFQAILDGGEHGVMLVVGRDAPRDLMVATRCSMIDQRSGSPDVEAHGHNEG